MRPWNVVAVITLAALAGCMAAGPARTARTPGPASAPPSPLGNPFGERRLQGAALGWPLILDRSDLGLGTAVQFNRIPTATELHDLDAVLGFRQLVISLPGWPTEPGPLEALAQLNPEASAIVILTGYPPSRAAAEVWNLIPARLRIVALVDGPPPSVGVVSDLNVMRGLERVIAQMDRPSRAGFERLQRPLSFRMIVE